MPLVPLQPSTGVGWFFQLSAAKAGLVMAVICPAYSRIVWNVKDNFGSLSLHLRTVRCCRRFERTQGTAMIARSPGFEFEIWGTGDRGEAPVGIGIAQLPSALHSATYIHTHIEIPGYPVNRTGLQKNDRRREPDSEVPITRGTDTTL